MLIGLMGYARTGKDTVADWLELEHGYTKIAFADALRETLTAINPTVSCHRNPTVACPLPSTLDRLLAIHGGWEGIKATQYAHEVRRLLQDTGTAMRNLQENVWVLAGQHRILDSRNRLREEHRKAILENVFGDLPDSEVPKEYPPMLPVVVSDVRYANEARMIRQLGGILVRVHRDNVEPINGHLSEVDAIQRVNADHNIFNNGTLHDLHNTVDYLIETLAESNV